MSRVFITFVGSHDFTQNNNGPMEQLIKYLKPSDIYIFITSGYIQRFREKGLEEYYKSLSPQNIEFIYTDIENPTNSEEIASKISPKIDSINKYILKNKYQGFLNLTSGTPAIISVLSLFAITGQLNRTFGLYAPNPEYDNKIKTNSLDFYKNAFAYQTIKNLINQYDYIAVEDFIKKNKMLPKLNDSQEFKIIVNFTKNRVISNFEDAEKIYKNNDFLHEFKFEKPTNLYAKSVECLMSAEVSERAKDIFQTTLKLGIIRENITSFLLQKILHKKQIDIVETKKVKDSEMKFLKKDVLEQKYPEIIEYLENELNKSSSINKKIDLDRELNSFLEGLLLKYFITNECNMTLDTIQTKLNNLEKLKKERNNIAHTINAPYYDENWKNNIKEILINTAIYLNYPEPRFDDYKHINKKLLQILKSMLN